MPLLPACPPYPSSIDPRPDLIAKLHLKNAYYLAIIYHIHLHIEVGHACLNLMPPHLLLITIP